VSDESHDTSDQRASVAQAAQMLGISEGAVRKRVERGKMRAERDAAGRLIVYLDATTTASDTSRESRGQSYDTREGERYTRSLEDQVAYLRDQLDQEREARTEERRRQDTVIAQLSQANAEQARTIRELEAPADGATPEARGSPESTAPTRTPTDAGEGRDTGTRRPWWRKVFGR
jgi:predicted transcriptional regulator